MNVVVQYGAYPFVLVFGIALHDVLLAIHLGVHVATYLPVIVGACIVAGLEWIYPYRQQWWADKQDMLQDAMYLVLIQGVLPKLLAVSVMFNLSQVLDEHDFVVEGWWPSHWPVPFQMLLIMIVADGLRYWLHRWAHEWEPLWRFHAVHHSPQKLYWLNVGRFHPIDKGLQVFLDTLPFLFLGVGEEVLGLYVVCYAINGFFQHGNVDLRLGLLNYLISGPELHRWHHSMVKQESNHNYGNNLIIWDLLFGTWYLPTEREVQELGLVNRVYPSAFLQQMTIPFVSGADRQTVESGLSP
jgi:sterol desaturase/sphingolipid hydroxylase (fatty acid hydroxylase superfamily)